MNKKFDKDKWILDAIARKYIVVMRDGEIWRAVRAHPTRGTAIKGTDYKVVKFQTHAKTGRVYFNMTYRGFTKSVLVNRVVALRYLPNPNNLPQVNHIDGVKANNGVDNLEWCSGSENEKHAHRTGLKTGRGSANSNSKLSVNDVIAIRASDKSVEELTKEYGVSRSTIANVINKRTWTHV